LVLKNVIDKFHIYEIKRKPSYYLKGRGEVKAEINRLKLSNVSAVDGEIIIKYHWMDQFKTVPPLLIEKYSVPEHPVGFIKVIRPVKSFDIVLDY